MCSGCQLAGPMAYITHNGTTTTLRALFRLMPPTTHHHEPEQSKVLAYIMELLGCTLEEAVRRFNSMRNPSSMVLRYDRNNAAWRGCDWMPDDQHDRETEAARSMRDMQKESKKTKTITKKAFNSMRNPSSRVLIYDRVHAVWHGCEWLPDTEKDADLMMNRKLGEIKKDIQRDKTWTRKREKEIKKLNEDMDEIYARVDAIKATMAEWKNLLPNLEKVIAEIRQEVKAISDLKAEVGSKYRFLIGSDELQDERLAVLEKRLGIDYLAGTPADSTQPS